MLNNVHVDFYIDIKSRNDTKCLVNIDMVNFDQLKLYVGTSVVVCISCC